ncbi:MAG: DUF5309 domain-containing protein [Bacteroidales bacterium]|nr:DUF5309 domain-containing protein [Bacteroidales bacterium]MCD8393246.1 DUF5309 domain-containing protein [Bacteroidales bacterium]
MKNFNVKNLSGMIDQMIQWVKSDNGVVTLLVAIATVALWLALGGDGDMIYASAAVVAGTAGGTHVTDGPLTTSVAEEVAPGLLRSEIDNRITKIRPMATPVDQITRCSGSRAAGSMTVQYYSVDTKETETELAKATEGSSDNSPLTLTVAKENMFEASETILVPSITASNGQPLVLYVVSRTQPKTVNVISVNNLDTSSVAVVPAMAKGTKLIRMGRAAGELDVQTTSFEAVPTKADNYCQIFKAQIEQSTLMKLANKEVGWTFSDQEEVAIYDMRLGMEKNFLFGTKAKVNDPTKGEVYLTGGIWNQAGRDHELPFEMKEDDLVSMCYKAFTKNNGSTRKILLAGSKLVEKINQMNFSRLVNAQERVTKWGIDFNEIVSKFGSLYVLPCETFDQCGHECHGLILDPEYVTKYCHIPFQTEKLDLRTSGQRNTDAIVITEASCMVLRYPETHVRVKWRTEAEEAALKAAEEEQ